MRGSVRAADIFGYAADTLMPPEELPAWRYAL